jgi:hypothetical protein
MGTHSDARLQRESRGDNMSKQKPRPDQQVFLDALAIWDRPEEQLYGKVFEPDVDTDAIVEHAFSSPRAGFIQI